MHPAPAFHTSDEPTLLQRFRDEPFCTLVAAGPGGPVLTHTPVRVGEDGSLRFHIANANRIAAALDMSGRALVATLGAHDYISPAWYGVPDRVVRDQVGTWNYISAEAEGPIEVLDHAATLAFLHDLAATFDEEPVWTDAQVDPAKMDRMLAAITAFRLVPDRLEGTTKLSQNKAPELRARVVDRLGDTPLAQLMREV